ncbi:MAG: tetratricopeptide repeat protein [Thermoanaerobaculia bacterium]
MRGVRGLVLLVLALWAPLLRGQQPPGDLGRIDFPTSGSPEAQAHFLRGALLLHSFEYEDAAAEFRRARKIEPGFVMACWGEAMTFNHPLWMERDRDGARKALEELAASREARAGKAPTRREKMYLDAAEVLYADGEKAERDRAYAEAMHRLHEEFPEDLDAASFYALALLGTCEGRRDIPTYMRAAAVVEEVFARNPEHPGAAHYLIHSYDDPIHAPLGMRAARVYSKIAPAATHALHMPSHIFLASGMWDEVAASNEAAWQASLDRAARQKLGADAHSFHALSWLGYAYLQQGRYAEARRTLELMKRDAAKSGSKRARSHLVTMRAAYLVETGQWNGDAARRPVEADDLSPRNLELFVQGWRALETGDRAAAGQILRKMDTGGKKEGDGAGHAHAVSTADGSGWLETDAVLRKELESKIAFAAGETDRALALAREAAALEDATSYEFGPPDIVKPAHELAGEMLLAAGRAAEARKEFEAALARAPRRAASLLGLARAASSQGDAVAARKAYGQLREVWKRADAGVAGLSEARRADTKRG